MYHFSELGTVQAQYDTFRKRTLEILCNYHSRGTPRYQGKVMHHA